MSTTLTHGYVFGQTELVTNVKLHTLIDSATLSETSTDIATNASIVSTAGAKIVNLYSCSAGSISTITGMLTNIPFMLINRSSGASLALLDASPFLLNGNVTPNSVGSNITLVWDGTNYIELGRINP